MEFPVGNVVYDTTEGISSVRVSPDGEMLALSVHPTYLNDEGNVVILDRQGKTKATAGPWNSLQGIAWSPSGSEVWFAASVPSGAWADEIHALGPSGKQRLLLRMPGITRITYRAMAASLFPRKTGDARYSSVVLGIAPNAICRGWMLRSLATSRRTARWSFSPKSGKALEPVSIPTSAAPMGRHPFCLVLVSSRLCRPIRSGCSPSRTPPISLNFSLRESGSPGRLKRLHSATLPIRGGFRTANGWSLLAGKAERDGGFMRRTSSAENPFPSAPRSIFRELTTTTHSRQTESSSGPATLKKTRGCILWMDPPLVKSR